MSQQERETNKTQDPYNIPLLKAELGEIGYDEVKYFEEIPTTMDEARKLALIGAKQFVVLTDHQPDGQGRKSRDQKRKWEDKAGKSILMTGFFSFDSQELAQLGTDMTALAAALAIEKKARSTKIEIKFPNDLVIDYKKLGGMLAEDVQNNDWQYIGTMIGIGINVHYEEHELTDYASDYSTTSLDAATGLFNSRQELVQAILTSWSYLPSDTAIAANNSIVRNERNDTWRCHSSLLHKDIAILDLNNTPVLQGTVIDTKIGEGIQIRNGRQYTWVNDFGADMKVRIRA